jgi:hypothetical protein
MVQVAFSMIHQRRQHLLNNARQGQDDPPKRNLLRSGLAGDCAAAGRMQTSKRAIAANAAAIQAASNTLGFALRDGSLNIVSSSNQYRRWLF